MFAKKALMANSKETVRLAYSITEFLGHSSFKAGLLKWISFNSYAVPVVPECRSLMLKKGVTNENLVSLPSLMVILFQLNSFVSMYEKTMGGLSRSRIKEVLI